MSDDRLFRRRRNGRPAGPWIAWGYDDAGQRWTESTKQIDRKAAEAVARVLERDHASPGAAAAREATLADAVTLLLTNRRGLASAGKRSDATVTFYEFKTGHWRRLLGDGFLLSRLTAAVVDKYIDSRREEEASEHTIAKELVALRCALKLAVRAGLWNGNPAAVLPVLFATEYTPRTRTLPRADLQKLFTELEANPAAQALDLLDEVDAPNAYVQYDLYHAQRMEGELAATLQRYLPRIGHIQFADTPGRHEPGRHARGLLFCHAELVDRPRPRRRDAVSLVAHSGTLPRSGEAFEDVADPAHGTPPSGAQAASAASSFAGVSAPA